MCGGHAYINHTHTHTMTYVHLCLKCAFWGVIIFVLCRLVSCPVFPGQYRKYKPCPGVPNVCSKIPDFDGLGYGVKSLCATRKRDWPDHVNCV